MLNFKQVVSTLEIKNVIPVENQILIEKVFSAKNTSELDFEVFTPEKILELANFWTGAHTNMVHRLNTNISFIESCNNMPHIKKRYGIAR